MSAKKTTATKTAKKSTAAANSVRNASLSNSRRSAQWFDGVIGQEEAKRELSFYLANHIDNDAPMPNLLLEGSQGDGKSYLAKKLARNFPDPSDTTRKYKKFYPVDGSSLKNLTIFFEDICSKFADGDQYCTVFVDEAHGIPKAVQNALLTVTEPNRTGMTQYTFNDITYYFDARKVTWIFATTEADKVFRPLRDRLVSVQLQPYGPEELAKIILMNVAGKVKFEGDTLDSLAHLVRRNARHADRLANNVLSLGTSSFKEEHLKYLVRELSLLPHGITKDEVRCLKFLEADGELSLGHLASRFGKPSGAVQKEIEPYLISLGYMEIDGKRRVTAKGRAFLKETFGKKDPKKSNSSVDII